MYLINPFFFISNVIYIIPERNYILIEKSCWNTMIHLVFKRRKPSPALLRSFKHLCYTVYVTYMGTGRIDYQFFNSQLSLLQDKEAEFAEWKSRNQLTVPVNAHAVEVEVKEETFFDDEYIKEEDFTTMKLLTEEQQVNLGNVISLRSGLETKLNEMINFYLSYSPETANLVNFIGFGRIVSLFRTLMGCGELVFSNIYEHQFFSLVPEIVSRVCRTFKRDWFFYCDLCKTINKHIDIREGYNYRKGEKISYIQEAHKGAVRFYVLGQPISKVKVGISQEQTDLNVQTPTISFSTVNLSQIVDSKYSVGHYLKVVDNMNLEINVTINQVPFSKPLVKNDNVFDLLKDLAFTELFIKDILDDNVFSEVIGHTHGWVTKNAYYYAFLRHVVFKWCQVYRVNPYYISGFLQYQEESISEQEMIDYFQNSDRNGASLVDSQNRFENMLQNLINP